MRRAVALSVLGILALLASLALPSRTYPTVVTAASAVPAMQIVGPGGSEEPLVALISSARARVLVEAFALTDPAVVTALLDAAHRGVDVRVMLDPQGLNSAATLGTLQGAGIRTRAPNPAYSVTHMNAVVVDAAAVAVATSALTTDALGPAGPGYTVVDRDRYDVLQAASVFYDDWLRRPVNNFGHSLVVLPDDASRVSSLIDGAGRRLELYTSYLSDTGVVSSLQAARGRGVVVRILTPRGSNNPVLLPLVAQHSQVRFRDDGAGTMLVLDRNVVLLGSMDLSAATLSGHREMGVVVGGQAAAALVDRVFFSEFNRGAILTLPTVRRPAPKPTATPQPSHSVTVGALSVRADVSPVVRQGGEGVIAVTTAPGAHVAIAITYPKGSAPGPGTTSASGQANGRGFFTYRWILSGTIRPGTAAVRIHVSGKGTAATLTTGFTIPK